MNLMDFKQEECTNAHCEVIASRAIGVEKDLEFAECALRRMLVRFGQVISCVLKTCYSRLHLIFVLPGTIVEEELVGGENTVLTCLSM
jgi:hypothetical protein